MIKLLLYKWFGLDPTPCATCEVLSRQLALSEQERRELLHKLLEKDKPEPVIQDKEEFEPIMPRFVPTRVKRQMMEAEDRAQARLMREKEKELKEAGVKPKGVSASVAELEKELGVTDEEQEQRIG